MSCIYTAIITNASVSISNPLLISDTSTQRFNVGILLGEILLLHTELKYQVMGVIALSLCVH